MMTSRAFCGFETHLFCCTCFVAKQKSCLARTENIVMLRLFCRKKHLFFLEMSIVSILLNSSSSPFLDLQQKRQNENLTRNATTQMDVSVTATLPILLPLADWAQGRRCGPNWPNITFIGRVIKSPKQTCSLWTAVEWSGFQRMDVRIHL